MQYFIPTHMKGKDTSGRPFEFFRGIHNVPDALANSPQANDLGIMPVEEMTDAQWQALGFDKDEWMAKNRPQPTPVAQDVPAPADAKPVAAVSASAATSAPASTDKAS